MKKTDTPVDLELSAMKQAPMKPKAIAEKLIESLSQVAGPEQNLANGENIMLMDENNAFKVLLLLEGRIDIWRDHDQLLVVTITPPFILGLQGSEFRYSGHSFRASAKTTVRMVDQEVAFKFIAEHQLFMEVMQYQSYVNDHIAYLNSIMINSTVYEMVCTRLLELATHPDYQKINACDYILKRTHLARSGVMKLLADLRFGGYIDTKGGKLVSLLKPFPKKY